MPQTVLIGLVVAIVGYFFQQRAWRHAKKEEIRQKEFDACLVIISALSEAVDKRLSATEVFLSQVNRGLSNKESRKTYTDAVQNWMHLFSSFKSKIFHHFGKDRMIQFENVVHKRMQEVSAIILRTDRLGKHQLSSDNLREHETASERLSVARRAAYDLLTALNKMTAEEKTGRFALYDNIKEGRVDLISKTYLFQRLLGLRS